MIAIQPIEGLEGRESNEQLAELFEAQAAQYARVEHAGIESDEWSVHRVADVRQGPRRPAEERQRWIELLRTSYVVLGDEPLRARD